MVEKTCVICGNIFIATSNKKTCSIECSNKNYTLNQEKYYIKHRDKKLQMDRERFKEYVGRTIRRITNKTIVNIIKEEFGCMMCNSKNIPYVALDFHHVGNKDVGVSGLLTGKTDRLLDEIIKCKVYCANCHRVVHSKTMIYD